LSIIGYLPGDTPPVGVSRDKNPMITAEGAAADGNTAAGCDARVEH
jgi:hypothetical protein